MRRLERYNNNNNCCCANLLILFTFCFLVVLALPSSASSIIITNETNETTTLSDNGILLSCTDDGNNCSSPSSSSSSSPLFDQISNNSNSVFDVQLDDQIISSVCRLNEFQCINADPPKCVPIEYRCDHDQDCPDGSDETGCFSAETDDALSNQTICFPGEINVKISCVPSVRCHNFIQDQLLATGSRNFSSNGNLTANNVAESVVNNNSSCMCELGFQVAAIVSEDNTTTTPVCIDEDECSLLGPDLCSQHCVNTLGSYKCECSDGFYLTPDGHTCKAFGQSMVLVFSNGTDIFISNGQVHSAIVAKLSNANDLAMEHSRNLIYWSDSSTRKIQRSAVFRPASPTFAPKDDVIVSDIVAPNGLTVDWLRRLLFWVDGGRQLIEVADLNAPNVMRRAIVWEDIVRPRDIVCHPLLGLIFWAEWGNNEHRPRIERINMDGSDVHMVAHKQVYRPCGLVIDFATDRLFWVDAEKLTLESSDLSGRHRTFVIPEQTRNGLAIQPPTRLLQPIACAVFEDFAYVSDQAERAVYRARRHPLPRDYNDVVLNAFTPHTYSKLGSLLVFHNATQPNFQITPCSATGLNCSHLCLPHGANGYTCACATGYTLQPDNRTCLPPEPSVGYIYLRFESRLSRISLDGPDFVDRTFFSLPKEDDGRITAFDVDLATSTFFFAKRHSADQMLSLYAASLNNINAVAPRHVLTLATDHSATGHFEVAFDWVTGNIYLLLASIGRIEVVSPLVANKTSHRAVVAWNFISSKEAHSLSLHPREGLMFWIDIAPSSSTTGHISELDAPSPSGESFYIIRSGLDGSKLSRFLEIGPASSDVSHRPNLIVAGNRLFWTSDKNHAIMSVKLDGTDKQVHLESANRQPTLLAAALLGNNDKFYFYDVKEMALFSTSLARNFSTLQIRPTLDGLMAMKIPQPTIVSTTPVSNPCRQAACSHLCLLSPELIGYRCACAIGYTLRQDGTTCSRNFDSLLLVAHGQGDLLQIDLTTPYAASLPLPLNPSPQNVVSVAADPTQNAVCWADNGRKMVACSAPGLDASVNGSEVVAAELDSVESIAYDYMNKNLYMADTVKPQIAVVHVPSGQLRLLLMRFTINQPRSLALSLNTGHLFWSEWNEAGTTVGGARIGRVDMDGSNAITIIDGSLGWPLGITVDSARQRVYWADTHLGRIESCDFEGDHRSVFLTSVNPYGLVVVGTALYWTDPESRTIRSSKLSNHSQLQSSTTPTVDVTPKTSNSNNNGEIKTIVSDTKNLFGLSILSKVAPDQQLTACDISCAGLCLRRPHGHRCLCPTGFQPTPTAASCQPVANQIAVIVGESAVSLVFLGDLGSADNSQQKQVAAKFPAVVLRRPTEQKIFDADLHWNSVNNPLYYAVTTPNSSIIFRTHLSAGFRRERLFTVANATVLSLAVDLASSNVYWFETRWSTTLTYLRVASITKLMVKTLLTNGFEQPKDLAVHATRGRLFWINLAGPAAIETSLGDGTERRVIVSRDTGSPASLTLDVANNLLYWTDTLTTSLHVSDLTGRMLQTITSGLARQAAVLAVSPTHIFWASGKGKAVFYAPKASVASNGQTSLRLTEMHQGVRGIGIYNQPVQPPVEPLDTDCTNRCSFICLRRGESQLVCTCPDSGNAYSCSGDEILNSSTGNRTIDSHTTVAPFEPVPFSQSLFALISVTLLFLLLVIVVVLIVCRQSFVCSHHQHRHHSRSRSDSVMSVILCDPCWWRMPARPDRGRSTSPHAALTSIASGGAEDDAGVALMSVANEKASMMPDKGCMEESSGDNTSGTSSYSGQRNQRQQQSGSRQCSTVVSLHFDGADGGDNITVKRVETVL